MLRPDRCRMLQRTAVLQSGATLKAVGSSSGVVFSAVVTVWNSWRHKTSVLEKAGCTTNRRKRFQYSLSNQICANFLRISSSIVLSRVPRCNLLPQKTCLQSVFSLGCNSTFVCVQNKKSENNLSKHIIVPMCTLFEFLNPLLNAHTPKS